MLLFLAFTSIPIVHIIEVATIPLRFVRSEDQSIHASSMFDQDTEELATWFNLNLIMPVEWNLSHPDYVPLNASNNFPDYKSDFINRGFKLWDIQNVLHATSYLQLKVKDSDETTLIAGRADFFITHSNASKANYLTCMLGVVEIQSKDDVKLCELQLLVYLLILMNTKQLPVLIGFLVLKSGMCKAFKSTRHEEGGCVYSMNNFFHVAYIADIFENITREYRYHG